MRFYTTTAITLCGLLCGMSAASARGIEYPHVFQPSEGFVNEVERPSRSELVLSGAWEFMPVYGAAAADFVLPEVFTPDPVAIKIPSPWNVNDFTDGTGGDFRTYPSYPAEWEKARIGWMRRSFDVPADFAGRRLVIRFDGIMGKAQIWVNGELAGGNFELFLPSEYDVTDLVKPGARNEITVGVAKASLFDQPGPYGRRTCVGGSMWGIEMAGIWQDVWLLARGEVHVAAVAVASDLEKGELTLDLEINNTTGRRRTVALDVDIRRWIGTAGGALHAAAEAGGRLDGAVALEGGLRKLTLEPGTSRHKVTIAGANVLDRWTPETPALYGAVITMNEGRTTKDIKFQRFGWRQFGEADGKLTLNGEPLELRGDSWHFTGVPQMTRRYAWAWYNMLKDANANAVRLHAMPFPEFYLDVADEMGICVLDESGIWSSDGGPKVDSEEYWASCREHLTRLVARDRNHPAVFGWSVCNETVPVVMHVYKAPEELIARQVAEINGWVALVRELDPTRPWISGDGETDRPTDLPTIIGHYGDDAALKRWSSQGKPWGVGETSMAYYGTPKQTSKINGNRSYESMEGRMEAIARESYDLIAKQRALGASYASVFNIVWYGLKPLPVGLDDESRAPSPEDGIYFPPFVDGRPGMQPERLGPWSTTLNPGYDPELPMYRPWPMFYAIQAANSTPVKPWSADAAPAPTPENAAVPTPDAVKIFAAEGSPLSARLTGMGLVAAPAKTRLTALSLAIVDGAMPPVEATSVAELKTAVAAGARMIVLGAAPEGLDALNKILPAELSLAPRRATSLLKRADEPLLAGLNHGDFYFSELLGASQSVLRYGLTGDMAARSVVALEAAPTDWQRWNYRAETSKTANVYRSETEAKAPGAAIIAWRGRIWISSLDFGDMKPEGEMLNRIMLANLGASFDGDSTPVAALDGDLNLREALILGAFNDSSKNAEALAAHPWLDETSLNPQPGARTGDRIWFAASADTTARIDIRRSPVSGSNENAAVYISFRIFSPRSLVNLLAEPNMPRLAMYLATADRYALIVNGREFSSGAVNNDGVTIPDLPLEKGWNHLVLKIARGTGNSPWGVSARFVSDDPEYAGSLGSAVSRSSLEITRAL